MMQRESRSKAAAAAPAPVQLSVRCPKHAEYKDKDKGPAWPNHPNIGLQPGDEETLRVLTHELKLGPRSSLPSTEKGPLQRAVEVYKRLPQSYKNKLWRKAADDLIATRHDNLLAPDSGFLPPEMRPMWEGMGCQSMCPHNLDDNGLCPWKDDCHTFYHIRQPQWNMQHAISQECHARWILEEERLRGDVTLAKRRATLEEKKEALRERMEKEKELSATMFTPRSFPDKDNIKAEIKEGIRLNTGEPDPNILHAAIQQFHALSGLPPFTLLDFQCAIADYFHDGMPGFRISSTKDPKISGIRVHDMNMIRIGKRDHQAFMYRFLSNVLEMLNDPPPRLRLRLIRTDLTTLQQRRGHLFKLPRATVDTMGNALTEWRHILELEGARIEDSLIPRLHLPSDDSLPDTYHISLSALKGKHPVHSYHAYLQSGKRRMTIHINKKGEVDLLTKPEARRVVTLLLFVLFGPSYEAQLAAYHHAQFTFDAHKGHMNRLLANSKLPHVFRLVTPYNIADSAMTEKFKDVDPDDEALAEEIAEEEDKSISAAALEIKNKIKEEAKIEEDEEEDEDDTHTAAQKGESRFAYTFNKGHALPFVVSDTNMIFDDNWLIYYKNKGFTQQYPYQFSMNLVDTELHHYITHSKNPKFNRIPPSAYTVEASFSTEITRGPSLNYLMMGLMRGSTSGVAGNHFKQTDTRYESLCSFYLTKLDTMVSRLLPIYTIPASSHSLPLFQHIAKAPLFAYHMLYDLQYGISALPSRIKWAGDREQYMAIKDVPLSVFVTLDTTGYYCALANGIVSLLERKNSMKLVGAVPSEQDKKDIAALAAQTPQEAVDPTPAKKGAQSKPAKKGLQSALAGKGAQGKTAKKDTQSKRAVYAFVNVPAAAPVLKASASKKKGVKNSMTNGGNYTRKNAKQSISQSIPQSKPGREYFFLNWLYPLTMSVHAAFYGHHAEHAHVLLQNLQKDLSYPLLFPVLQEQLIHAVSLIPNVPEDLVASIKNITAETYDDVAPECLSRLEALYTSPDLSIFSQPAHKETLLGYLREMKEKLTRRLSNDPTTMMLRIFLTPDFTPDQEKVCLTLALLFERLHGRIQNGTSYLGQILGVTGGPELECVDDQDAWEYLTDVLTEDMAWITDLAKHAVPMNAATMEETVSDKTATANANVSSKTAALPALATPPNTRRISAKLRHVKRGPAFRKMNNAFTQLRSNRALRPSHTPRADVGVSRAPTRPSRVSMTQNARRLVMGGSRKKTRRAKRAKRDSRQSRRKE